MASLSDLRLTLPDPLTGLRAVRHERQNWQRLGRAEGELVVGYDGEGRPVRVEYHWLRHLAAPEPARNPARNPAQGPAQEPGQDPAGGDVYTAELWVRQEDGDWLYLVQPAQTQFRRVAHALVRPLLQRHLNVDPGA